MDLVFLIESVVLAADDPLSVQENDKRTSPKHNFGSNPDCADSG